MVADLKALQKWQYLDNHSLTKDDVSKGRLCEPVRRPVTNYSAKVTHDQTYVKTRSVT